MKASVLSLLTALALFACSDAFSPPPELPYSRITYICSWTGPGHTGLTLQSRFTVPFVYVTFPERATQGLPAGVLGLRNGAWVAPSDSVFVEYWTAMAPDQHEAGSGTITITRAGSLPVLGKVDLQFGSQHISGEFSAEWEEPAVC
jgi:hypothetical protein